MNSSSVEKDAAVRDMAQTQRLLGNHSSGLVAAVAESSKQLVAVPEKDSSRDLGLNKTQQRQGMSSYVDSKEYCSKSLACKTHRYESNTDMVPKYNNEQSVYKSSKQLKQRSYLLYLGEILL